MTKIYAALAATVALAFGGCAQVNTAIDTLSSPKATQAAQNIGQYTKAFACGLSAAAAAARGVEGQTYAGSPIVDDRGQQITEIVYASSTAACQIIGGVLTSVAPQSVPAAAVVK